MTKESATDPPHTGEVEKCLGPALLFMDRRPFPCHPVDKPKGLVKGERVRRVAVSNSLAMSLETWRQREPFQEIIFQWKLIPPAIDTDKTAP